MNDAETLPDWISPPPAADSEPCRSLTRAAGTGAPQVLRRVLAEIRHEADGATVLGWDVDEFVVERIAYAGINGPELIPIRTRVRCRREEHYPRMPRWLLEMCEAELRSGWFVRDFQSR